MTSPKLPRLLPQLGTKGTYLKQVIADKLIEHKIYIAKHGEDLPEIREWKWSTRSSASNS